MTSGFPGGIGVSGVRVYDTAAPDGVCGGAPHAHLACAEAYVVVDGAGSVQTLTWSGYQETALASGTIVWFTPGTVHRAVNHDGRLRLVVVMQNGGLPEAGDAVFTFPAPVLADRAAYAAAATVRTEQDAKRRRDLAVAGFAALRAGGQGALEEFHTAAFRLVADKLDAFERRWRAGPMAAAEATGEHLARLRRGDLGHLRQAAVEALTPQPRLGMCGHLQAYDALSAIQAVPLG